MQLTCDIDWNLYCIQTHGEIEYAYLTMEKDCSYTAMTNLKYQFVMSSSREGIRCLVLCVETPNHGITVHRFPAN